MLRARQSVFLPEITAVHHTLKCYVYGSLAHVSILKCPISGNLNFGRSNYPLNFQWRCPRIVNAVVRQSGQVSEWQAYT